MVTHEGRSGREAGNQRADVSPVAGMMLHQDSSPHEWGFGGQWDIIGPLDDAPCALVPFEPVELPLARPPHVSPPPPPFR